MRLFYNIRFFQMKARIAAMSVGIRDGIEMTQGVAKCVVDIDKLGSV